MTTEGPARYSPLDSNRFGRRIFRAEVALAAEVAPLLSSCAQQGAEMLVVRCPAARLEAAQALEAGGCILMDTLVYYGGSTSRVAEAKLPPGVEIRGFRPADLGPLEAAARKAFTRYGGHYHADPRLDPEASTEGYVEWFRTSTTAADFTVLVAALEGAPSGFLTLRRAAEGRKAEIVLNAVDPSAQGRGLYQALVRAAAADCRSRGEGELIVSTQIQNLAPQKVWVRCGLEPLEAHYTFHRWFS